MKTACNEIINKLKNLSDTSYFNGKKSDCDIIDRIQNIVRDEFLEIEKQQIIKAYDDAFKYVVGGGFVTKTGDQYFEEMYNDKN